jgi:hypothetical protein
MHPGANPSHNSCTLYGCRAAASGGAPRKRAATAARPGPPTQPGQARRPWLRTRRAWLPARRATSSGSPTPAARPPTRSASVPRPSAAAAVRRDDRDALGREADPGRRAGAAPRRAGATGASARPAGAGGRPAALAPELVHRIRRRARRGQELRPDRPRAQREPGTDGARRRPVVAFNCALGPPAEDAGRRSATVLVMSESLRVTIV